MREEIDSLRDENDRLNSLQSEHSSNLLEQTKKMEKAVAELSMLVNERDELLAKCDKLQNQNEDHLANFKAIERKMLQKDEDIQNCRLECCNLQSDMNELVIEVLFY
jgi:hypothetical protein